MPPLVGRVYDNDKRNVHSHIVALTNGGPGEEYIKKTYRNGKPQGDGRKVYYGLVQQFDGLGARNRRISEADSIRERLFYKNERALPFQKFSERMEHMFNIYSEEGEAKSNNEKL